MNDDDVDFALDERADHIPLGELRADTAEGDFFDEIHRALISRGTKLLVGPRGCGKTHMMRYTWLQCKEDPDLPLAVYVSFNKYYRLEPLLKSRTNAVDLFHAWVVARVLVALSETLTALAVEQSVIHDLLPNSADELETLIGRLERNLPLSLGDEAVLATLGTQQLIGAVERACDRVERRRAVLLLDDAALTLTPEYLFEFFDIVRVIRSHRISPKASVYPATDFGPRFHATHEADSIPVWLSIDRADYLELMGAIGERRMPSVVVPGEVAEVLKFAAFGVPRAYLVMLREYARQKGTQQQRLNRVVESHAEAKRQEHDSMALKVPRFSSLIRSGSSMFDAMVREIRETQQEATERGEKQITVGILESEITKDPLIERMFDLLIESGLLFENQTVSHGVDRIYRRYTPHVASLIAGRAVTGSTRGSGASDLGAALKRKSSKHPLRRALSKLTSAVDGLALDLPPCRKCGAQRLAAEQKFCHLCGSELLDGSTYSSCMGLPLTSVPGLTAWQRASVSKLDRIKTIGDLLAIRDPGTELRKLPWVGNIRASRIVELVTTYVDEFLS